MFRRLLKQLCPDRLFLTGVLFLVGGLRRDSVPSSAERVAGSPRVADVRGAASWETSGRMPTAPGHQTKLSDALGAGYSSNEV